MIHAFFPLLANVKNDYSYAHLSNLQGYGGTNRKLPYQYL